MCLPIFVWSGHLIQSEDKASTVWCNNDFSIDVYALIYTLMNANHNIKVIQLLTKQ